MPYMLAIAAAGMIYVAAADLIPGLHRRPELRQTGQQLALILLGVATVWLAGQGAEGWLESLEQPGLHTHSH